MLVYTMNKLINEAIYMYWVTDHMLPYEALHVYCQWLSATKKIIAQNEC